MIERPDGRLKPGELKSGSYGFYDKGNQKKDALSNLEVDVKPRVLERPKGKALPLKDYINGYSTLLTFSGAGFAERYFHPMVLWLIKTRRPSPSSQTA